VRHIQDCLPDEYKQRKKKKSAEQSTGELTTSMSLDDDKKVPEQKSMTVDTAGYEEAFEDVSRPKVESAAETVKILQ
jgi:hypothetical protein